MRATGKGVENGDTVEPLTVDTPEIRTSSI